MNPNVFANSIVIDDTQLWYLAQENKTYPVLCTPVEYPAGSGHHRVVVEPALPAKMVEVEFLARYIGPHLAGPTEPRLWVVMETTPEEIFVRARGITPSFYYRGWDEAPSTPPEPSPPEPPPDNQNTTDAEDFLNYLHSTTNILPMLELRAFWHMLSNAMFVWLYKRQRTIDFGCVRLVAMPYRKNWAECLLAGNPKIRTLFNRKGDDRMALLLQSDWYEHLFHPLITAVNRHNNTCQWTIHAVETECWMDSVTKGEARVRASLGPQWYGQHWMNTVKKHEREIFETFEAYLDQAHMPNGRVAQSSVGITPILVPNRAGQGGTSSHPVLRLADGFDFDAPLDPIILESQNEKLQALPAIQFKTENVRNTGNDLSPCASPEI